MDVCHAMYLLHDDRRIPKRGESVNLVVAKSANNLAGSSTCSRDGEHDIVPRENMALFGEFTVHTCLESMHCAVTNKSMNHIEFSSTWTCPRMAMRSDVRRRSKPHRVTFRPRVDQASSTRSASPRAFYGQSWEAEAPKNAMIG